MKTSHILSIVGTGSSDIGALTLGDFSKGSQRQAPTRVSWGESSYLVGEHVLGNARPLDRLDMQRLSDGPGTRALTYATLAALYEPGNHHAYIMAGFPVGVLEDAAAAERTRRGLRSWLVDNHQFTVDGEEYSVLVPRVSILPQPAGAYFAWGMDNAGQWTRGEDALTAPTAVCDIGRNTLDVFTVQAGAIVREFTGGDTAGMRRAVEHIRRVLAGQYNVDYNRAAVDQLLCSPDPVVYNADGTFHVGALVEEAKQSAAAGILAFLEDDANWGNGRQFRRVLFTGGGAEALRGPITTAYPHAAILPDPVMANAVGLARYLRRVTPDKHVLGLDPGFGGFKGALLTA